MSNARILVVDDDQEMLKVVSMNLTIRHFDVSTAQSGEEALAAIDRDEPDLVILDALMPGMDGIELCQRVRRRSKVPVVMLTARVNPETVVEGVRLGAIDYIPKDIFSAAVLLETLRQLGILEEIALLEDEHAEEEA